MKGQVSKEHKALGVSCGHQCPLETLQARREWQDILRVMKEKKPTTQITIPSKGLIQI